MRKKQFFSRIFSTTLFLTVIISGLLCWTTSARAAVTPSSGGGGGGRICVFFAPNGAPFLKTGGYFGHVGWSFSDVKADHWYFGATEDYEGHPIVKVYQNIYAWDRDGTWNDVLDTFKNQLVFHHHTVVNDVYHDKNYYTQYRCKDTAAINVNAAFQVGRDIENQDYNFLTNNCLTDVQKVFIAYDDKSLAVPDKARVDKIIPSTWFNQTLNMAQFEPITNL